MPPAELGPRAPASPGGPGGRRRAGPRRPPPPLPSRRGRARSVTAARQVSHTPRAHPTESNPGPRLALLAGHAYLDGRAGDAAPGVHVSPRGRGRRRPSRRPTGTRTGSTSEPSRGAQRPLRVLEAVAGDRADDRGALGHLALAVLLQQAGDARGRAGLDEHPLGGRQQPVGVEDLLVGDGLDAGRRTRRARPRPAATRRGCRSGSRWRWSRGRRRGDRGRSGPRPPPGSPTSAGCPWPRAPAADRRGPRWQRRTRV